MITQARSSGRFIGVSIERSEMYSDEADIFWIAAVPRDEGDSLPSARPIAFSGKRARGLLERPASQPKRKREIIGCTN